jgi:hypothetical protein
MQREALGDTHYELKIKASKMAFCVYAEDHGVGEGSAVEQFGKKISGSK